MKNKILIIISIFIILLSVGCGSSISVTVNNDSGVFSTYADTETEPIKKNEKLDIHTVEKRENELVFNFSIDDLIDNYNGYYHCDKGSDFLSPSGEWNSRMLDKGIHSLRESTLYAFSVDPKSWVLPTMWVFVTPEDGFVQEITLNFDWHSYSEKRISEMIVFRTVTLPHSIPNKITGILLFVLPMTLPFINVNYSAAAVCVVATAAAVYDLFGGKNET